MRLVSLLLMGLILFCVPVVAQDTRDADQNPPRESGLVETSGVELVLIDVDVRDREGNPRPGLPPEDFEVFLNGRSVEIESIDELCAQGNVTEHRWARTRADLQQRYFVLYFDYSQMDELGRELSVTEAARWLRNLAQQTSLVMVVAYSTGTGVERLTGFVPPDAASRSLGKLKAKRFRDPWPLQRMSAIDDCGEESSACVNAARLDLGYSRRSLRALLFFLTTIDSERESKTLLLFHQNITVQPSMVYGPSRVERLLEKPTPVPGEEQEVIRDFDFLVGDHWSLLREVSGTAFVSRTTIYPVYASSNDERWSVAFGANLAQQTGGEYNRSLKDLRDTMRHAEERRPCTYRIGIRPVRLGVHLKSRLRVEVQGERVLSVRDIRFPNTMDRWQRRAEAVLANPESSRELPLEATLLPVLNPDGKWGMIALVSFDARVLEMLPESDRVKGKWEVGALVVNHRNGKVWEMLGVSEVTSKSKPGDEVYIVHEYLFPEAKPGEYEIRAFIRDKWTNVFGGGKGVLTLPKQKAGTTVGPVAMRGSTDQVRTTLPLRKKKIQRTPENTARNTTGPVPIAGVPLERGAQLEIASWACGDKDAPPRVFDAIVVGEQGIRRLSPPALRVAGHCAEATSVIDTADLGPGAYEYVIRWGLGGEGSTNGSIRFHLGAVAVESPETP